MESAPFVRLASALLILAAVAAACGDDSSDGSGGKGGAGGSDPCSACDQICAIAGCEEPTYTCLPVNGTCDGPPSGPVCGCDGVTVEASYAFCTQAQQRMPRAPLELCQTGTFECGTASCRRNAEICVVSIGGPTAGETHECVSIETVNGFCSGIPDCACMNLSSLGCGDACACSADADHQETVVIQQP